MAVFNMAAANGGGDMDGGDFELEGGSEYTAQAFEIACQKSGLCSPWAVSACGPLLQRGGRGVRCSINVERHPPASFRSRVEARLENLDLDRRLRYLRRRHSALRRHVSHRLRAIHG